MDTRNRGLSDRHTNLFPKCLMENVTSFAESIDHPVGQVSWGSALWARVAAQNTSAISAVAAYEPGVHEVMGEEDAERFEGVVDRMGELIAVGELTGSGPDLYREQRHHLRRRGSGQRGPG